jgi:hypothetical protein
MGIMAYVRVNTTQRMIIYRDFVIQESIYGWERTHQDEALWTSHGTLFECIEAIEREHDLTIPGERP